jgi:glycosyltransferase involved in cell wall biosynthesis
MNICFFTENNYKGGLDTFIIQLSNNWPSKLDKLTLVCNKTHPGLDTIKLKANNSLELKTYSFFFNYNINNLFISFYYLNIFVKYGFYILYKILEYPILFPYYIISLNKFFKKSNYEKLIVINGGYPASLICRCAIISWYLVKKQKAILNFHNNVYKIKWYNFIFEQFIDLLVCKFSSTLVTVSNNCLKTLDNRYFTKSHANKKYIYNGIDDPTINLDINLNDHKNVEYCLMLATFEKRKGHHFLINSFKEIINKHNKCKLFIYGFGSPKEVKYVQNYINKLHLMDSIKLFNFSDNKYNLIYHSKLLLVPSQANESFGLTVIEAMALSIPVVITNVGGMPEILHNSQAGYISNKDNTQEFSNHISLLLNDKKLYNLMSTNARIHYENNFTANIMAQKYYDLLNIEQ